MADPLNVSMPSLPITSRVSRSATASVPSEYITAQEIAPAMQEQSMARADIKQQMGGAEAEIGKLELERGVAKAEEGARLRQEELTRGQQAPERERLRMAREELSNAAFIPTKQTTTDLATLFSLMSIVGMAIGGEGRANAYAGMAAMNGMLEGYQKGRADLYKQERDKFDKNLKAMQLKVQTLETELKDALDTYKNDRMLGEQMAEVAFAKANSPILEQKAKKQGLNSAYEFVVQTGKDMDKLVGIANDQTKRAEEMQFREKQLKQQDELRRLQLQQMSEARKERLDYQRERLKQGTGGIKPSAKIQEAYIADNQLSSDIRELRNRLQDTELVQQIKQYGVESFLSEEGGKVFSQLMQRELPPKLRSFLTQVRDMRNNYYLTISGKAVTGGEAMRNYGVVPQPGDSQEIILDKLSGMENRVNQKVRTMQTLYGLPDITASMQPGMPTMINPNENYSISSSETPAVPTQKYKLNNREIVVRNGKWVYADTGEDAK